MFDTIAGKFERGPYFPRNEDRSPWETTSRERFDTKLGQRIESVVKILSLPEARIMIAGDSGLLRVESSLPKLLHGNNFTPIYDVQPALVKLRELVIDLVDGDIPDLIEADYTRVDYCHNFPVGAALPDYIATLGRVKFLKHHRVTDDFGAVEYWNDGGGRRIRVYDKFKEIQAHEKRTVPEAFGLLRYEIQLRKKSQYLQNRLSNKSLTLGDVLNPRVGYSVIVETLNKMCLDLRFAAQDSARVLLDDQFGPRKATRLLGILRRFESEGMEGLRTVFSRSTYYADKRDLRALGLWPPSATETDLPGLVMPSLEDLFPLDLVSPVISEATA